MSKRQTIEHTDIGRFEIDNKNKLYWDNKPIKAENVVFSWWQKAFATILAVSTILAALTAVNSEMCWISIGKSCTPPQPITIPKALPTLKNLEELKIH